jgi:hypothetical protein
MPPDERDCVRNMNYDPLPCAETQCSMEPLGNPLIPGNRSRQIFHTSFINILICGFAWPGIDWNLTLRSNIYRLFIERLTFRSDSLNSFLSITGQKRWNGSLPMSVPRCCALLYTHSGRPSLQSPALQSLPTKGVRSMTAKRPHCRNSRRKLSQADFLGGKDLDILACSILSLSSLLRQERFCHGGG